MQSADGIYSVNEAIKKILGWCESLNQGCRMMTSFCVFFKNKGDRSARDKCFHKLTAV